MPAQPTLPTVSLFATVEERPRLTTVWVSATAGGRPANRTLAYNFTRPGHCKLARAFAEVLRGVGPSNATGERTAAETILALAAAKDAAGGAAEDYSGDELRFCAALLAAETTGGAA